MVYFSVALVVLAALAALAASVALEPASVAAVAVEVAVVAVEVVGADAIDNTRFLTISHICLRKGFVPLHELLQGLSL